MNFSQLHERLRLELLRRIDRGALTGAMLARQTGFPQSHISNFLHRKRTLSLPGLDRLLAAQMLSVTDLLDLEIYTRAGRAEPRSGLTSVPVVTHAAAMHEPQPSAHATLDSLHAPSRLLDRLRSRRAPSRRGWMRFVAIRVSPAQSAGMEPVLTPDSLVVLDRHYNSLHPYSHLRPTLHAVRSGNHLLLRYASFELNRLILRPLSLSEPVHLLALGPHESPADLVIGRACLALSDL